MKNDSFFSSCHPEERSNEGSRVRPRVYVRLCALEILRFVSAFALNDNTSR